jgi:hypothetical protein
MAHCHDSAASGPPASTVPIFHAAAHIGTTVSGLLTSVATAATATWARSHTAVKTATGI